MTTIEKDEEGFEKIQASKTARPVEQETAHLRSPRITVHPLAADDETIVEIHEKEKDKAKQEEQEEKEGGIEEER